MTSLCKRAVITAILATGVMVAAAPADAAVILTFRSGSASSEGTIDCSGGTCQGTGISLDTMEVTDGVLASYELEGTVGVTSDIGGGGTAALFEFETGPCAVLVPGISACGPGGFVTITGDVPSLGIFGEVLVAGSFLGLPPTTLSGPDATGKFTLSGFGVDVKSSALLTALGIAGTTNFTFATIEVFLGGSGEVESAALVNTQAVAEPASALLLGLGFLGTAAAARRRIRRG